jgi:flagellum-specific peptidoglycan hydrolase FlgJ
VIVLDEPEMKSDSDYIMNESALTVENVLAMLQKYDVKFPKIVLAQALLETGNFSSDLCRVNHNLFGLRHPSDGSYYSFNKWEESVKSYRDDVQYKYTDGDYYAFLSRIGYAEDRNYTSKVRRIANTL